jgi:hypothetical protein
MQEYLLELGKGGSVAGVAFNPCGVPSTNQLLYKEVLKNIFVLNQNILGKAVFAAKCSVIARYPFQDTLYGPAVLWTLFGDPALRIKRPGQTGVAEAGPSRPAALQVELTPNPGTRGTAVRCVLPVAGEVSLRLYDAGGRLVRVLYSGHRPAGEFRLSLEPADLGSGVGFVQLRAGERAISRKLVSSDRRP